MKPSLSVPAAYELKGSIDLSKNKSLALITNIAGAVLLVGFGWLFTSLMIYIRPGYGSVFNLTISSLWDVLKLIGIVLGVTAVMVLVHEGLHGMFFWLFTGGRPFFGFRGYYAYASAPGWYIPRNPYLVICMAPFVLITAAGLALLSVIPGVLVTPMLLLVAMNAAGAVGDLMVFGWLLIKPSRSVVQDFGDGVNLYID